MRTPPISCIIVDDELFAAEIIAEHVSNTPFLQLAGITQSPVEALEWIEAGKADLMFLDIQMPDINGVQLMQLAGGKCRVIVVSGFGDYAMDGIEHNVIDYLLKPVPFDRFLKAAQRALQVLKAAPAKSPEYVFLKGESKNKFVRINTSEILFVQAQGNYVKIHTLQGAIMVYQPLGELEEVLLSPAFARIHKSYIAAINKVELVENHEVHIGGNILPVSESYRDAFYQLIRKTAG